ncbi:hypothetical protein BDV98DRAFT_568717, partial [Pterulicium gracile]
MHRLVWLPPSICDVLGGSPRCLLTISRRGRATLNFTSAKLGNDWAQCYTSFARRTQAKVSPWLS